MGIKRCHERKIFKIRATKSTDNVLQMFPKEDRDGNMRPIFVCTLIIVTIATI